MENYFEKLPAATKGLVALACGIILLLHMLGINIIEKGLGLVIFLAAVILIIWGLNASGIYKKVAGFIKKKK
jgi:hypothetical protein